MFVNLVKFGYFVLFGLLKEYFGQALVGETGSDVTLVIEIVNYPLSCNEINIIFHQLQCISSRNRLYNGERLIQFINNGVQCLSIIDSKYETRIFNVSIKFPTYVTFGLRNVSLYDAGCYHAMDENRYFMNNYSSGHFKQRILLVGDTILKTCTLKQMELEFVFPLYVFNETVAVVFCSGISWSEDIISTCNPEAGTCRPPSRATFPRFQCRMNGSRITITLTSVQMEDEGIYALIGSTSRIAYESAVLKVIECVSTTPASDIQCAAATITDKSFENYFVGGGVVAGMTIVILICWLLWKRCYEIRGDGAGGDDLDTDDVHYYCSIRNQNEPVTQAEATTGSIPESQQLSAVMDETTVYDNI